MALLNAGYWPTTYWSDRYWEPNYWPKYGAVTPPTIVPGIARPVAERRPSLPFPRDALELLATYLEIKLGEHHAET